MALALLLLLITLGIVLAALAQCAAAVRLLVSRTPFPEHSRTPNLLFVDRLFSAEDWEFVRQHGSEPNRQMFRASRFALALSWSERVRCEAARIWTEHRAPTRCAKDLRLAAELRLLLALISVQALCRVLEVCLVLNQATGHRTFVTPVNRRLFVYTQRAFLSLARAGAVEAA